MRTDFWAIIPRPSQDLINSANTIHNFNPVSTLKKMDNNLTKQVFSTQFKYPINSEVRHRADFKSVSSDMSLFILNRMIEETDNSDGAITYTRSYICRMVRFSGSGDLGKFVESELMSVEEYEQKSVEQDMKRKQIHQEMKEGFEEIYDFFGVKRGDKVYLNKGGVADKSVIYKIVGCGAEKNVIHLTINPVEDGSGIYRESVKVTNLNQFQVKKSQ